MLRELRLLRNTWSARIKKPIDDLSHWADQLLCKHSFRPAIVSVEKPPWKNPAKICRFCDKTEVLTKEEFFAEFGETGMVTLNAGR